MSTCLRCGGEVSASDIQCAKCGEALRKQTHELVGTSLADKYLIEEHLGTGGMCDVYRATHSGMGKQVAVKVLKPALAADSTIAQRFEQEARAASLIHHPHAINVMDYGIGEGNVPFIVMEFVKGKTLGELLRSEGAFSVERTANILRQASGALDVAHSVGVVHRDIKPDNIIIAEYDGSDWVEVVDFGVAKIQEDVNRRINLTGANIIVGTPRYMSPEQCEEKPVDARSDIYSLGIVLYEMLSNEAPFKGDSSTRLLVAHSNEPPEPLRNKRPDLKPELEAVVMRALEKDPARRPQSAGELARDFQEAAGLGQPAQAGTNRGGAFSRISVPIGEEDKLKTPVAAQASVAEDEATIVRPRPAQPTVPLSDTPANQIVDTPVPMGEAAYGQRYPTPAAYAASAVYRKQTNTGGIIALVAVILVVAGVAAYIVFGNRLSGRGSTSEAVIDAQQSVTEAIARVDSLPKDHPLRSYMNDLRQWQGELKAYQEVREDNAQVTDKADRYRQKAQDISDQARAALAALGRPDITPNTNTVPASSTSPQPGAAKPAADEETADADDEKTDDQKAGDINDVDKQEDANKNANKNTSKPRNAEPPIIDPVKPPSENEPKNSNKSNKNSPPMLDKIQPDSTGGIPNE